MKASSSILIAFLLVGCEPRNRPEQFVVEAQTVVKILKLLQRHDHELPSHQPVTNLTQVFADLGLPYPYEWHAAFAAYGETAGFTNSIFEKYVFFPPAVTNYLAGGEIVFMNAHPYPDAYGNPQRTVISKRGSLHQKQVCRERDIQRLLAHAGVALPKSSGASPSLPALEPRKAIRQQSLFVRAQNAVFEIASSTGLSRPAAAIMWYSILALPVVSLLLVLVYMTRRHRG